MTAPTWAKRGLLYIRDSSGTVHVGDEAVFGGVATACDVFDRVTVVEPVPDDEVCVDCLADPFGMLS